jgi:hypothetical protein
MTVGLYVIPACRESFLKKDSGQARMTEIIPKYFLLMNSLMALGS